VRHGRPSTDAPCPSGSPGRRAASLPCHVTRTGPAGAPSVASTAAGCYTREPSTAVSHTHIAIATDHVIANSHRPTRRNSTVELSGDVDWLLAGEVKQSVSSARPFVSTLTFELEFCIRLSHDWTWSIKKNDIDKLFSHIRCMVSK